MILPPINLDEEVKPTVLSFPGTKKQPAEEGPYLQDVGHRFGECQHRAGFVLDDKLDAVICKGCNEKLSPMWVLRQLASVETRWHRFRETYQDEMKRLAERSKTKCRHCGEMTPISRS
ncbi:hypothetical protein [Cupriavidus sp. UYPR2.512]|uniref:hypothetical protein n=1 Tax=Cupriavidus sp. UYPR2.512 TaxID=1080187 RepID=UPI00037DE996|nr:hypothetical protein [Cupriavidus sp. UYPR2.512]UIF90925.1 hypothetical protein KAF44_32590 [Cupriavidus necator]